MTRPEKLRRLRQVYTLAWREFLMKKDGHPKMLFCFFEGEDNRYYVGRITSVLDSDFEMKPLVCGGKDGVIRVNELWHNLHREEKSKSKCLFFLDRDFDSKGAIRAHGLTYVTPSYSIENLYATRECVGRILENEFAVRGDEDIQDNKAIDYFESMIIQFLDASVLLNAWIFLQRKFELAEPQGKRLNLGSVKFNQLFGVSKNGVTQKYNETHFHILFPESRKIADDELFRYAAWLRATDRRMLFRGKYFIEFVRQTLEILKNDRCSRAPSYFKAKAKVSILLSRQNLVSELSQYADTPHCLKNFMRANLIEPQQFLPQLSTNANSSNANE